MSVLLINGNALRIPLADESVHCVVTSPVYWGLRDYNVDGQLGLEPTPEEYIANMVAVFREVRRVLRSDGTCWVNLGSSYYSGGKPASQFHPSKHVLAYNNDGKELQDCLVSGRVYHGSCGEHQDETQNHHLRNVHSALSSSQALQLLSQITHDNELPDYAEAFLDAWLRDVLESNMLSSSGNDLVVFYQQARALVSQIMPRSFSGDASLYVRMLACMSDIVEMSQTSDRHKLDKVLSFLASMGSLLEMDGITWAYFTIPSLKMQAKDLVMIPHLFALALQVDGWIVRSDIVWSKPNPMPESVTDRPTKSHEYLFLLTKSARYFYDAEAVREEASESTVKRSKQGTGTATYTETSKTRNADPMSSMGGQGVRNGRNFLKDVETGRNRRTVWTIPTRPYSGSHFATYPPALVEPCIKAGTSEAGCCSVCGKPWERMTEKTFIPQPDVTPERLAYRGKNYIYPLTGNAKYNNAPRGSNTIETLGFRPDPDCTHYDEYYHRDYPKARSARKRHQRNISGDWWTRVREQPGLKSWNAIPCTVFDPFLGSGTTAMVARSLGRNAAGIDLSADYLLLARKRLSMDRLEAWENGGKKRKQATKPILDLPLFGSMDERIENE